MRRPWLKWPENITTVYESWRPLYYVCDYFLFIRLPTSDKDVIAPFETSLSQALRLAVSAVVVIVMILTNVLDSTPHFHVLSPKDSPIESIAGRLVISLGSSAVLVLWVMSKFLQTRYASFMRNLHSIDKRMLSLNYTLDLNSEFRDSVIYLTVVLTILHVVVCITHPIVPFYNIWIMVIYAYLIYIENGPLLTNNHTCILFIRAIKKRFIAMNEHIRTLIGTIQNDKKLISDGELIDSLTDIAKFHCELTDRVEDVNFCFGFQMLVTCTALFFYGVFSGFAIYRATMVTRNWDSYTINNFFWSNLHLGTITFFIKVSSRLTYESIETGILVHKLANILPKPTVDVLERFEFLSQQFQHRSAIVSCGMFEFNWMLWYTLVVSTVSMVVLLIEFESSFGSQSNITTVTP
uniref:Gustatory receptor n=1 Tax=Lutzomyia longipalpis TaxID=7200 RepID=A0A3F2ZDD4_LUTLO